MDGCAGSGTADAGGTAGADVPPGETSTAGDDVAGTGTPPPGLQPARTATSAAQHAAAASPTLVDRAIGALPLPEGELMLRAYVASNPGG